jgi:thiol-disulfide isomerase/thioredoxin
MKPHTFFSKYLLVFASSILLSSFFYSNSFSAEKPGYQIKIKVKGLSPKDTCFLAYYYGDNKYLKDTAIVGEGGNMVFSGKENLPGGLYLLVYPGKKYFELICNEQNFSLETDTIDPYKYMKVKNTLENQIFYEHLNFLPNRRLKIDSLSKVFESLGDKKDEKEKVRQQILAIDKEVKDYKGNIIKTHPNTFVATLFKATEDPIIPTNPNPKDSTFAYRYYKQHYFDNIDFNNEDILRTPVFHERLKSFFENMVYRHPDSINKAADFVVAKAKVQKKIFQYCVYWITNHYETANWMGADAIFVHMVKRYYTKDQAFWLDSTRLNKIQSRANVLEPLLIGKKAPNLYLQDTSAALNTGNQNKKPFYQLYDVKAKYTVMIFFDPDCGHCQKEVPKLYKEFYSTYRNKNVQVYAINATHGKIDSWKKMIKEHKLDWLNVHDSGPYYDFSKTYDITSYPVIYLLDQNKIIKGKRLGVEQLGEIIDSLEKDKQ